MMRFWKPEFCLAFLFLLLYVPFLGEPVLRTTGDEKVYVAQALEMARNQTWFAQTLADHANYYKPPLHYILLRAGFQIFGQQSLWAVLWMNLAAMTLSIMFLVRSIRQQELGRGTAWWVGLGVLLSPGIFAHMFASQMEIELVALYSVVLGLLLSLNRSSFRWQWLALWITIGLASWIKSPVHSVLMGVSTIAVVWMDPEWHEEMRPLRMILAPILGIGVGLQSMLIPWLLDGENYYRAYIVRETLGKGPNAVGILQATLPNLSYHLWPMMPALAFGTAAIVKGLLDASFSEVERRVLRCTIGLIVPTLIFFIIHPYRSEIYMLPIVPALILWATIGWQKVESFWPRTGRFLHKGWLFTALLPAVLVLALYLRFHPDSSWWPERLTWTVTFILLLQLALIIVFSLRQSWGSQLGSMALWFPAFVVAAAFMQVLGRFDIQDFQRYASTKGRGETFGFYNAQNFVWSEWGLLNFTGGVAVKGLHRPEQICAWLKDRRPLIVTRPEQLQTLQQNAECGHDFEIFTWTRWQSHGDHNASFGPKPAWMKRDLKLLQGQYFIVRLKETGLEGKS